MEHESDKMQCKATGKQEEKELCVLELYSGIGGMHCGLEAAVANTRWKMTVEEAMDINTLANQVYQLNFNHKVKTVRVLDHSHC